MIRVIKFSFPLAIILFIVLCGIDLLAIWLQIDFGSGNTLHFHNWLFFACFCSGFGIYYLRDWAWYRFENFRERPYDFFPLIAGVMIIILITWLYIILISFSGLGVLLKMIFLYILQYAIGYLTAVAREWARDREGWWSILFTE